MEHKMKISASNQLREASDYKNISTLNVFVDEL